MTTDLLKDCKTATDSQKVVRDILSRLAGLNRNIVSDEFEESLNYLSQYIELKIHRYRTSSACWTWEVPPKWRINDGYIKQGDRVIVSIKDQPLHVMSYSIPVNQRMRGEELLKCIYVHREIPHAIPYEYSFYVPKWGFCLTHEQRDAIKKDEIYDVVIDSELINDYLSVGEYTVRGTSDEHIFFLCHIDHPCQVNDGLIGCAVNVALAKLLREKSLYYNYTFLFVPETIGSIAYLSRNEHMISRIRYSIFVEMVGFNHPLIIQKSFREKALINRYAAYVLKKRQGEAKSYPFLTVAGNDEKIFDSPGVNIPSISITRINQDAILRKKVGQSDKLAYPYAQYHSHLDDLSLVNYEAACDAVEALYELCQVIDKDFIPIRKFKGPVFLTKYGLWHDWRTDPKMSGDIMKLMYLLEGDRTVFEIAEALDMDFEPLLELLNKFYDRRLIEKERISVEFDRAR